MSLSYPREPLHLGSKPKTDFEFEIETPNFSQTFN